MNISVSKGSTRVKRLGNFVAVNSLDKCAKLIHFSLFDLQLMDIEQSEEIPRESVSSSVVCGGEATSHTGLPGVVLRRRDSGSVSTDRSMPSTTSLHDLSDVLHPESHYPIALPRVRQGVEVHGTIRRWHERASKNSVPPHPRSVIGFLASGHQESAV